MVVSIKGESIRIASGALSPTQSQCIYNSPNNALASIGEKAHQLSTLCSSTFIVYMYVEFCSVLPVLLIFAKPLQNESDHSYIHVHVSTDSTNFIKLKDTYVLKEK